MKASYPELVNNIKQRRFTNAYLLHGAEDFLMEQALGKITKALVDPSTRDFNFDFYYASETDAGRIVDAANAYPMMADCRVVVVKELQKLSLSGLEFLGKYLERPSESTRLVLLNEGPLKRNKAIAKIQSNSCSVEFKPLYERQVVRWMQDHLKEGGYRITEEAALMVHARVGNNLRDLVNELDKIILNMSDRMQIEAQDAQDIVGLSRSFSLFDLNDALGEKDLHKSLRIASQLLGSGESATGMVARITRHFVNLVKIKGAAAQGKAASELAAMTGIPPFFITKSLRMAKNYGQNEFGRVFECLLETDLSLKTSAQPTLVAMQSLIVRIVKSPA